ncbi:hypothetical protein OMW55_10980 [Sphingomonas sp. BN140010]|uniref:Uncharacterized protein n=1 Tax=Sphingomonas arvum TaxID=2992113 RepID=A0ABT3JHS2_9SPHN|nr:hypothetical protein [Sphingomonas sp. BN140010]MCW3798326.1 hypothetical protein [Sphingomonas sp. BN140010]
MSAKSFRSVGWVAGIAATALGCYMVNLKVASERAQLEDVETRIVLAQRDIRLLQTEIGTRGRLAQLEQWNVKVLALSAPKANQFLEGSFQLATLTAPKKVIDPSAPVVLASAPAPVRSQPIVDQDGPTLPAPALATAPVQPRSTSPTDLMHVASLKRDLPDPTPQKVVEKPLVRRIVTPAPAPRTASLSGDSKGKATATVVPAVKVTPKPKTAAAPTTLKPKVAPTAAPKPKLASATPTKPKPPLPSTKTKEAGTKR